MTTWKNKTVRNFIVALSFLLGCGTLLLNSWLTIPIGLVYAVLIPGFLIFITIRREVSFSWSTVIYSSAFGVTAFMFLALLVNMLGFLFGDIHSLTIGSLVSANFLLICALCVGYKRWSLSHALQRVRLSKLEQGLIGASLLVLICFVVGATNLNNGSNGWLSFICFLSIPVFIIILFWKHTSIRGNVTITTLWLIALGLLLSGWLRSWYVSGPDVSLEYRIAEIVGTSNRWSIDAIKHAYNSCLSVSLFAPAIGIITKSSLVLTFKFIIPLLYSLIVPIVYLITSHFLRKRAAIIATGFFIAQPVFVVWWWIPIRQQVAFLLFGALLMLLVQGKSKSNRILLLILSLGLVVAHYTTALIAIAYFIVVWIISYGMSRNKKISYPKSPVPLVVIILLIASYFIWYAQSGVTQFAAKSLGEITSSLNGKDPLSYIASFSNKKTEQSFDDYQQKRVTAIREAYGEKNMYSESLTSGYATKEIPEQSKDSLLEILRQLFVTLSKAVVAVGVLTVLWLSFKNKSIRKYAILSSSAFGMLVVTAVLPSFSVSYDLVRTYQQLLFVMAGIFSIIFLLRRKYRNKAEYALLSFVVIFFVLTSHTLSYVYPSSSIPVNLSSQGSEYTYRYVRNSDILLGTWLMSNTPDDATISGDSLARDRMRPTLDPNKSQAMLNTVLPSALPRSAYVIKNRQANAEKAYDTFESKMLIYNYPTKFLNETKNVIYSNSGNQLYR